MLGIPKHAFNYFIHNAGHKHNIPNLDQEIGGRGTESGGERKVSTIELGNQQRLSGVRESDETEGIGQGASQPERGVAFVLLPPPTRRRSIEIRLIVACGAAGEDKPRTADGKVPSLW